MEISQAFKDLPIIGKIMLVVLIISIVFCIVYFSK